MHDGHLTAQRQPLSLVFFASFPVTFPAHLVQLFQSLAECLTSQWIVLPIAWSLLMNDLL